MSQHKVLPDHRRVPVKAKTSIKLLIFPHQKRKKGVEKDSETNNKRIEQREEHRYFAGLMKCASYFK